CIGCKSNRKTKPVMRPISMIVRPLANGNSVSLLTGRERVLRSEVVAFVRFHSRGHNGRLGHVCVCARPGRPVGSRHTGLHSIDSFHNCPQICLDCLSTIEPTRQLLRLPYWIIYVYMLSNVYIYTYVIKCI